MTTPTPTTPARTGRAFTLVEMLIVVVIIVILISILLPAIGGARNAARRAATESFMSSIHQAIGQFRAAEQRMPGYYTVQQVGSLSNYIEKDDATGIKGITYMENALLDLGGGIYEDQDFGAYDPYNDPTQPPDVIRVGIGVSALEVNVQRTAIGAKGGPGYLDIPEGFIDMGRYEDGRAGKWVGHKWMPRLIDSWGMPILLWPRNEFSKRREPLVQGYDDPNAPATNAPFYWAGNSAFTNAPRLGKGTQKNQRDDSALSSIPRGAIRNPNSATGPLAQSFAAVIGHPAFPDPVSLTDSNGPQPAEPRGDVILQSAGPDGLYLETENGKFTQYHYIPEGYDFKDWQPSDTTNYIEKSDDQISSGS